MDVSRRSFLSGGTAAFGTFFGLPAFAPLLGHPLCGRPAAGEYSPKGWRPSKKPNLVFGVLSDTHMRVDYNKVGFWRVRSDEAFRQALRYFKRNDVDAVMHCGDWADRGSFKAMEFHSRAWYDIFPGGMNNGKKIEKLFVIGNHDVCVGDGEFISWVYGSDWPKHALKNNLHRWPELWREEYSPAWHKTVKGYHFFGYDIDLDREKSRRHALEMVRLLEEEAAKCGIKKSSSGGGDISPIGGDDGTDSKFQAAVKLAVEEGKISTSLMQRRLGVGYGRAAKIIDCMEEKGYVSKPDGNKPRRVLLTAEEYANRVTEGTLGSDED